MYAAVLFVIGTFICACSVAVLAVAGWWFAKAVREAHTARAHAAQADSEQRIIAQAEAAVEDVRPPSRATFDTPTDDELKEIIRMQRQDWSDMDDVTTEGNEGVEPSPIGKDGGMYR